MAPQKAERNLSKTPDGGNRVHRKAIASRLNGPRPASFL
jgi:hypothetical protein